MHDLDIVLVEFIDTGPYFELSGESVCQRSSVEDACQVLPLILEGLELEENLDYLSAGLLDLE
jgi:hypothetical protein